MLKFVSCLRDIFYGLTLIVDFKTNKTVLFDFFFHMGIHNKSFKWSRIFRHVLPKNVLG